MSKYTIGIDFGTLSARAVLADVQTGRTACCCVHEYQHGVMETALPGGTPLPENWALQDPGDYLDALYAIIPELFKLSNVDSRDVIGIGIDFTSCTVLPVNRDGIPLCKIPRFSAERHAYVKHWKHHSAQDRADRMTLTAKMMGEEWLQFFGGKVSGESSLPKLWELLDEAPEIYAATAEWMEAGDWIVEQLTGRRVRNSCAAGYKCYYIVGRGYPDKAYFRALDPRLENVVAEKLSSPVVPSGSRVGTVTDEMARRLGLAPGTSVAAATIDAHACVLGAGITRPGTLLAIMGTSSCYMVMSPHRLPLSGVSGVVEDGIFPGHYGYEAGQSAVGDIFAWFTSECVPPQYYERARARNISIHEYLSELCLNSKPGESGLIALDWWNGNRSTLSDANLTGLLVGMNLQTRPEEIYRTLIEATAFGARVIIDNYQLNGVDIEQIYSSGGISCENPFAMQIYADVLNRPVNVIGASQGPALGSAIWGATAAGRAAGGYDDVTEAVSHMSSKCSRVYTPNEENSKIYAQLFEEYRTLHDYFGRGVNDVMKRLLALKEKTRHENV